MPFGMPPGLRIPYHSDGTVGLIRRSAEYGGGLLDIHATALAAMNSETTGGMVVPDANTVAPNAQIWGTYDQYDVNGMADQAVFFSLFFPLPTRIRGLFLSTARSFSNSYYDAPTEPSANRYAADSNRVEVSKDSTNGIDGTWQLLDIAVRGNIPLIGSNMAGTDPITGNARTASPFGGARPVKNYYRNIYMDDDTGIRTVGGGAARNVRAVRVFPLTTDSLGNTSAQSWGNFHFHLYGEPDTDALGQNYLQGWRSDSDMRLGAATLSWGDVPLSSSGDKTFRIKNMSDSDTANDVVVDAFDGYNYPVGVEDQFLFSLDGGDTFFSSVTLGGIGPGTVSSEIIMRRVTPATAPLTTYSPQIRFTVGSWT